MSEKNFEKKFTGLDQVMRLLGVSAYSLLEAERRLRTNLPA
jgi:hypothetical protein